LAQLGERLADRQGTHLLRVIGIFWMSPYYPMNDRAKHHGQIKKVAEQRLGVGLTRIKFEHSLAGHWRSDSEVYEFSPDRTCRIDGQDGEWAIRDDGDMMYALPSFQDPNAWVERMHPFQADDGRVVLLNDDASVIRVLERSQ
jgi:hypothetical protein